MDFDSPDVAKEFPGLYMGDTGKTLSDPTEYDEEGGDKKKKKDKKDSKKDKGYAALAGESSHEEDEAFESKSPGKIKKIKAFKLSTKKKDKKPGEKEKDKEKERKSSEKDKDKDSKKSEKERRSSEKEKEKDKKSAEKVKERERKSIDLIRRPFSGDHLHHSKDLKSLPSTFSGAGPSHLQHHTSGPFDKDSTTVATSVKDKTSVLNAFLNAPAPILLLKKKDKDKEHKDKEHKESKKEKEHAVSKVKLKLKRSKNSLEDSHLSDSPVAPSHQFPEDPDSIAKEIRKYEILLETTHTQIKSSKKVSKKQEEQLWELQRTLTQLKRKLRSVNALSSASSVNIVLHPNPTAVNSIEKEIPKTIPVQVSNVPVSVFTEPVVAVSSASCGLVTTQTTLPVAPTEKVLVIKENEMPKSKTVVVEDTAGTVTNEEIQLDFTLKTFDSIHDLPAAAVSTINIPKLPLPPNKVEKLENNSTEKVKIVSHPSTVIATTKIPVSVPEVVSEVSVPVAPRKISVRRSLDLSEIPVSHTIHNNSKQVLDISTQKSIDIPLLPPPPPPQTTQISRSESPKLELERVQVQVQVHHTNHLHQKSLTPETEVLETDLDLDMDSENVEILENIVDDANKMIGSIHEELEAAALVFGSSNEDFSTSIHIIPNNNESDSLSIRKQINDLQKPSGKQVLVTKSEPTLGDEDYDNDSDFEFLEDQVPDPFTLPLFESEDYLAIENEALVMFNEQLQEEVIKEEADIESMMEQLVAMGNNGVDIDAPEDCLDLDDYDSDELISLWQIAKLENEALNDNVNGLRMMVAMSKLDQFRLETLLKYLEDRVAAISPITITTPLPLQTDV